MIFASFINILVGNKRLWSPCIYAFPPSDRKNAVSSLASKHAIVLILSLQCTGCPKTNGTQVNGYNFVTADSNYLKFCRHKVKILNDKHAKNKVNRTRRTCSTRYHIPITIFAKRVPSASPAQDAHINLFLEDIDHSFALIITS